jgi:hypothetical protein
MVTSALVNKRNEEKGKVILLPPFYSCIHITSFAIHFDTSTKFVKIFFYIPLLLCVHVQYMSKYTKENPSFLDNGFSQYESIGIVVSW